MKNRKILDTIHGFIRFPQEVWTIIDTPAFQRLREIKQLGALYEVFHTTNHSRFEHCIGTAYLCQTYMEHLIENNREEYKEDAEEAKLTVTLAGLLHDIGHGPFSHMFDNEFMKRKETGWNHEDAGKQIIRYLAKKQKIKDVLTPNRVQRIVSLIDGTIPEKPIRQWEYQIVSNKETGIDVDKFDYFRRDAYYLGIKSIYVEHELLIAQTKIIKDADGLKRLCYPSKYADKVMDIFHSRYKLYRNYYQNRHVKGIEVMICEIFNLVDKIYGIRDACKKLNQGDPQDYCRLTDNIIYQILHRKKEEDEPTEITKARDLMQRVVTRQLYKYVAQINNIVAGKANKLFKMNAEEIMTEIKKISKLTDEDLAICTGYSDNGQKQEDPMKNVKFYNKYAGTNTICKVKDTELGVLKTERYIEHFVRVYAKNKKFDQINEAFRQVCSKFDLQPNYTFSPWKNSAIRDGPQHTSRTVDKVQNQKTLKKQNKAK